MTQVMDSLHNVVSVLPDGTSYGQFTQCRGGNVVIDCVIKLIEILIPWAMLMTLKVKICGVWELGKIHMKIGDMTFDPWAPT